MNMNENKVRMGISWDVNGRARHSFPAMDWASEILDSCLIEHNFYDNMPFSWISLVFRIIEDEKKSRIEMGRISKKYGDIPVTIECHATEVKSADREGVETLGHVFLRAAIDALHAVGEKYEKDTSCLDSIDPRVQNKTTESKTESQESMEEDDYGINIDHASKRAVELIPYDFFWDCTDELAPFGSDEGDTALGEYRDWRRENPDAPIIDCLKWTIESLAEMELKEYTKELTTEEYIKNQLKDKNFNDEYYIYTVDISVIATGFGQLVDEGKIDSEARPVIDIALDRQITWTSLLSDDNEYKNNLEILKKILKEA